MTTTTASLPELLTNLGSTADEIAGSLAAAGITGELNAPCSCAIANYLSAQGFASVAVAVEESGCYVVEHGADVSHTIGQDGPIPDFIRAFDAGAYPHLIQDGSR